MNRKQFSIFALFGAGFCIPEIHHFAKACLPYQEAVNWFILPPRYAPDTWWYFKELGTCLRFLLCSVAAYKLAILGMPNTGKKLVMFTLLVVVCCAFEVFLYVLCFQVYGYDVLIITFTTVATWIFCKNKKPA